MRSHPTKIIKISALAACAWLSLMCGNGCSRVADESSASAAAQSAFVRSVFRDTVTHFEIDVAYEPGAAPYVGALGLTANQTWDITKTSYAALFSTHASRTLSIPSTLGQMTALPALNHAQWSGEDLIALGTRLTNASTNTEIHVAVIFVNGLYENNANTLGIHFTGHPFVFIFKDVVTSTGGDSVSQRYVEQGTVVHEVGHAVGLVNLGLPMVNAHEDTAHPAHTTDTDCVMYWMVESKANVLNSLLGAITSNKLNLFGSKALADARAYHP